MLHARLLVLAVAACSSPAPPRANVPEDASDARRVVERRWLAGDIHMHVAPPDDSSDVRMAITEIADAARANQLDFVVLTPHLWPGRRGAAFDREWKALASDARAIRAPIMIPGVEWTTPLGHFTVAGIDITQVGKDFLASAHELGAFISVNHPFAVPTKLPAIRASHFDMSYRAWTATGARPTEAPLDGVEVFNVPLALANLISRPGGKTGEERAWLEADRLARIERRRLTPVGGTDNHALHVVATTWVLAYEATETAILEALRAGATCIGGPEAGTFRATGDDGKLARIGDGVQAAHTITLVWDGLAQLFVDGIDAGEHIGGFVAATAGLPHTYRIVVGASRSGFIYANL
ncbi:MAG TPA: CehA/McbA family metallohydrolase [Kofleriaceae bacterium]